MKQFIYTIRYLTTNKASNLVKVISLTLGLALGLVIFSQVAFERSYDKFFPDAQRMYRLRMEYQDLQQGKAGEKEGPQNSYSDGYYIFHPAARALVDNVPEAQAGVAVEAWEKADLFRQDGGRFPTTAVLCTDSSFFSFFRIEIVSGDPEGDMAQNSIFLSQELARRIFGDADPVGQILQNSNKDTYMVAGVYKDLPRNTHLKFDAVMPPSPRGKEWKGYQGYNGYVRLAPGADPEEVAEKFAMALDRLGVLKEIQDRSKTKVVFTLEPLTESHMAAPGVSSRNILLGVLGFCLLLAAVLNYVLVSVSSLSARSRTLAVHKCNGARSWDVFRMFMYETGVLTVVSSLLAVLLIVACRGWIQTVTGQPLSALFSLGNLWVAGLVLLCVWVIAGVIPGIVFSSVSVMAAFRSSVSAGRMRWKALLLFFQFMAATFLLVFLLIIIRQYNFMLNRDMGYRYENLVYISAIHMPRQQAETIKEELRKLPCVEGVSVVGLSTPLDSGLGWEFYDDAGENRLLWADIEYADEDYLDVMGIELVAGKNFEPGSPRNHLLLNESAVRKIGWTDNPIGKTLENYYVVDGVVKDFQIGTLHAGQGARPVVISSAFWSGVGYIMVELSQVDASTVDQVREAANKVVPDKVFNIVSYKEELRSRYRQELLFRDSVGAVSIFTVFITMIGLIGYIGYEMHRRRKEIALRKINGASLKDILAMVTVDMGLISILGVLLGLGGAYYAAGVWLTRFEYKVPTSLWLFMFSALTLWVIIAAVVVLKAWKAAGENPVKAIKSE